MSSSKFDPSNPYILIEEAIIGILDEKGDGADNKPIEEVDNVQIGDVVVNRVGFKDAKIALMTTKEKMEQKLNDITLEKEMRS